MAYDVTTAFGINNLVNDNSTDNTAKLNAIFGGTTTPALTAPYTLYFPGGAGYKFATTPTTVPANVTIYGDGKEYTVLNGVRAAPSGGAVLTISTANVTIRDLTITTPDTANACDQCITIGGATGLFLERVKFSNGNSALIRVQAAAQLNAVQCEFVRCYQFFSASGISGQLYNSTITNCWFHDNNGTLGTQHCIYLNGPPVANVSVTGCVFENYGGEAVAFKGDPVGSPGSYALACSVTGCQFIPNATYGSGMVGAQKVQGLSVVGNSFYTTAGCTAMALYNTISFTIADNNYTSSIFTGSGFTVLADDGSVGSSSGAICGNVVSISAAGSGVGNMSVGQFVTINNAHDILIADNNVTGFYAGVVLNNVINQNADISIINNRFLYPRNWTHIPNGSQYYFGNPNTFYGVAFDGAATRVQVLDNVCERLTYELFFTNSGGSSPHGSYAGQVDQVRFRSTSWAGDNTNTFGFQGSAAPTNVVQVGSSSVPVTSTGGANPHAFTTSNT